MKIFLNKALPDAGMELLKAAGLELLLPEAEILSRAAWIAYCQQADVVVGIAARGFDAAFFEQCPNVKAIALFSVGYDQVDIAAATQRRIPVSNTPDVLSRATSDVAFLLMQSVSRLAAFNFERVKSGNWPQQFQPTLHLGQELYGKTLGIFGMGRIGLEMARKCKAAFDMKIIYHNRNRRPDIETGLNAGYVTFDELLAQSDVLSLHANYTSASKNLFDAAAFRKMKANAILVNTARGGFIREQDLYEALSSQRIWGAGLDVSDPEPMSSDNPLLSLPNVCVLPHIGSATVEARNGMAKLVAENVIAFVKGGRMPTAVNVEVYE